MTEKEKAAYLYDHTCGPDAVVYIAPRARQKLTIPYSDWAAAAFSMDGWADAAVRGQKLLPLGYVLRGHAMGQDADMSYSFAHEPPSRMTDSDTEAIAGGWNEFCRFVHRFDPETEGWGSHTTYWTCCTEEEDMLAVTTRYKTSPGAVPRVYTLIYEDYQTSGMKWERKTYYVDAYRVTDCRLDETATASSWMRVFLGQGGDMYAIPRPEEGSTCDSDS